MVPGEDTGIEPRGKEKSKSGDASFGGLDVGI
jgi:hypothetical protein